MSPSDSPRDQHRNVPHGRYLIGQPAGTPVTPGPSALETLQDEVVTHRLRAALHDIAETVALIDERHTHDNDPAPAAEMERICSRHEAPLILRSLHNRVRVGLLTWDQIWHAPSQHDGGMELLAELVRTITPADPRH